ncbi:3' terminal RNA ribose 2'-O-methyltransferase Hen1 [Streptomyces sp. AC536]|uniref:3' terminal RNA ribose 2'-O-methyltransferase Hen1 n=1 Tax=Streptomyces buecherae TaxID=2763006 RepID=UPI00164E980E|nr:3' terminal RNA ribose 2'-O-methyltransferase Hen1 [Streptomyces buecherae]MBC3982292.1 3' terminal RNA ribose 2'-O-methyltransferase Hen1 [Streptomyces buecherae]QNJ39608.1 3' terminal RNA ribose 2'-O-methyltransferase Hen1 [Streptomyces buecherae]
MFLSLTMTGDTEQPATDLGFLLHKHPEKVQRFTTSHGVAHVFYPEASPERCTAALLLEVDTVALVRGGRGKRPGRGADAATAVPLGQYVNDRPYAASSLLAVALRAVFSSALQARCAARPELVERPLPLRVEVPALPSEGGADLVERMFAPLGWRVRATPVALDERFPEWGAARYVRLVLTGEARLADALRQLYVLLPVLDDAKHYWVAPDEVEKLLRSGEGWLAGHPEQELIAHRYLARSRALTRDALERLELARLAAADDTPPESVDNAVDERADTTQAPSPLAVRRREAIVAVLREVGAARVLDLGCGQGQLLAELMGDARFTELVGVDVSQRALGSAARRLRLDQLSERQAARVRLMQGSLAYTDGRLRGYDAAVLSEVVEHVDPPRLPALAHAVFGAARPRTVVITTPNAEYNVRWSGLAAGQMRHADHRFEWTRQEFGAWAEGVARRYGYGVEFRPVGPDDPEVGPPTQLALFTLNPPATAPTPAGVRAEAGTVSDTTTGTGTTTGAGTGTTTGAGTGTTTGTGTGTGAGAGTTTDTDTDREIVTATVQRDEVTA